MNHHSFSKCERCGERHNNGLEECVENLQYQLRVASDDNSTLKALRDELFDQLSTLKRAVDAIKSPRTRESVVILENPSGFLSRVVPADEGGWDIQHRTRDGVWTFFDNVGKNTRDALINSEGTVVYVRLG